MESNVQTVGTVETVKTVQSAETGHNGQDIAEKPIGNKKTVETVLDTYANMPTKEARLMSAVIALDNPADVFAHVVRFIGEIRALARQTGAKSYTFPKGHECEGFTGRDALNAILDERESNGKVRARIRKAYKR
jgi:hypothetical protein